jgi:DNA-binding phage protein
MPRRPYAPPHAPDALDRLRELVAEDGHSIADIATGAGMSRTHLHAVLSGDRANPSITTVATILAALGRSWSDLDSE